MTQWKSSTQPVRCIVDLTAPLTERRERGKLVQGDKNANAIVVEAYQGKDVPYDLTGSTVTLTFVRPDKLAVSPIKAQITGNVAVMTLTEACYRYSGLYAASVELHNGETDRTIVRVLGDIISTENDGVVDEEQIFPSPEELLETLLKVEQARVNAETAANRANTAAARAEQLQIDASGLAGDSNKLGGKAPEYYIPAVNLLDNSDFAIAQAGYNGYHGETHYAADRWSTGENGVLTVSGKIKTYTSNSGYVFMSQNLWNDGRDKGKSYTLAIEMGDGTVRACSGTVPSYDVSSQTVIAEMYIAIAFSAVIVKEANGYFIVRIDAQTTGATASFKHVWLVEGIYTAETMPPYVPRPYAVELAECQLYYRVYKANQCSFSGFALNGILFMDITFESEMRTAPSLATTGLLYSENANASSDGNAEKHDTQPGRIRIKASLPAQSGVAHHVTPLFDVALCADL